MRIRWQLFLWLAALAGLSLLGLVAWQQRSFSASFADYLDALAQEQARPLAERLQRLYEDEGGWQALRAKPMRFGRLVDPSAAQSPPGAGPDAPPPPPGDARDAGRPDQATPPARPPSPAGPPPGATDAGARFALYDAESDYVAGNRRAESASQRFTLQLGNQMIGELRLAPAQRPRWGAEDDFARQQWQDALLAAAVTLLLAWAVAWLLSRSIGRRIETLAQGARQLTAGDYQQHFALSGRDELGQLGRDFNRLAQALDDNRQARQRWSADIAHELRTPLTILRSELQLLADRVRPRDDEAMQSLQSEVERLAVLIEDLNHLSLADAGALDYRFAPLAVGELIEALADRHQRRLNADGLVLEWHDQSGGAQISADERRLAQALDNLLLNAGRYTDAPGRIRIKATTQAGQLQLCIEDTPPGVSDVDLPLLFDRLYRAESSRARKHGGSGLGLAITQAIVQAHGGSISASHSPLGGLRMTIELPLDGRKR